MGFAWRFVSTTPRSLAPVVIVANASTGCPPTALPGGVMNVITLACAAPAISAELRAIAPARFGTDLNFDTGESPIQHSGQNRYRKLSSNSRANSQSSFIVMVNEIAARPKVAGHVKETDGDFRRVSRSGRLPAHNTKG